MGSRHYAGRQDRTPRLRGKIGSATNLLLIMLSYTLSMEIKPRPSFPQPPGDFQQMEDTMYEFTVMITMLILRIVLPLGLLFAIGEMSRRSRQPAARGL